MTIRALRFITNGKIRSATFRGAEHLVVPVVALVEGVIQASNADTPELVLASEFGNSPASWNGRPVMFNHPTVNGEPVSANSPGVLEESQIGSVFNAHLDGKKLKMEAWLNPTTVPNDVVSRLNAGGVVEVSVGVLVDAESKNGVYNGTRYSTIWRNIYPDHLAMLPDGTPGACDVKMGCGAPRAASDGASDHDIRAALWDALFSVVPALLTVVSVYPETSAVIYCAAPDGEEVYYRRTYSWTDSLDNGIILNDDAVQVERVEEYKPVSTVPSDEFLVDASVRIAALGAETMKTAAGSCGCGGTVKQTSTVKEDQMKKDLIKKILAAKNTPFVAADEAHLDAFSEERLTALSVSLEAEPTTIEVEKIVEKPVEVPLTKDRVLAAFPDLKAIVEEKEARDLAQRATLVAAMKGSDVYTEAELNAMPLSALDKIVRVAGKAPSSTVVDFAGRGTPRTAAAEDEIPDAPDVHKMIRAARGIK